MKRGRKSASELATIVVDPTRTMPQSPPPELNDAQAQVWRDVIGSMRADWLDRAGYPLLVEYCRHVCRARRIEALIAAYREEWLKRDGGLERLDRLHNMADRETKAIASCARALRLTPQSRITPVTAARMARDANDGPKPWDPPLWER